MLIIQISKKNIFQSTLQIVCLVCLLTAMRIEKIIEMTLTAVYGKPRQFAPTFEPIFSVTEDEINPTNCFFFNEAHF